MRWRIATFAGLITAGLAVAMQSVLLSVVGYFFLIGKYGVRVGDRVQIGTVTGEVIDMGLVRMHLMELSGDGPLSPTGRVVAFANSIVFQASGGWFKQIPGVDLAWREITLGLPPGADQATIKDKLAAAVTNVIKDYREDIVRQTREIQKASSSSATREPRPQVQLRFSAAGDGRDRALSRTPDACGGDRRARVAGVTERDLGTRSHAARAPGGLAFAGFRPIGMRTRPASETPH